MRTIANTLLLAGLLAVSGACKSGDEAPDFDPNSVTCICGTPEAAFDGCPHPLCLSGEGNPDNPECVCGAMQYEKSEGN